MLQDMNVTNARLIFSLEGSKVHYKQKTGCPIPPNKNNSSSVKTKIQYLAYIRVLMGTCPTPIIFDVDRDITNSIMNKKYNPTFILTNKKCNCDTHSKHWPHSDKIAFIAHNMSYVVTILIFIFTPSHTEAKNNPWRSCYKKILFTASWEPPVRAWMPDYRLIKCDKRKKICYHVACGNV